MPNNIFQDTTDNIWVDLPDSGFQDQVAADAVYYTGQIKATFSTEQVTAAFSVHEDLKAVMTVDDG